MASHRKRIQTPKRTPQSTGDGAASRPSRKNWIWVVILVLAIVVGTIYFNSSPPSTQQPAQPGPDSGEIVENQDLVFARYAGSESCRECHQEAFSAWKQSNHGLAERPLDSSLDMPAFDPPQTFKHGTQTTTAQFTNNQFEVVTLGFDGQKEAYPAKRVIGNDPLQQFLVEAPRGRLQTLEASYDPHRKEWFNVYGEEDRQPGEWGHWTGRGMAWNSMCASCHNTRLRKNYDEATDSYQTAMVEMSVGCESCHGPLKGHVDWHLRYPDKKVAEPNPPNLSTNQMLETCGTCHSRRYQLTDDFKPGDDFDDHHLLTIVDGTDLYYPDGQVLEEDYEFASFLSSRMHGAGVTCVDCHHPHMAKPTLQGNQLCLRCHTGGYPNSPLINPVTHSFHDINQPGGLCVNCHMPQTTYMQRHPRHDHGFTIPDPLLTKELGIPNACNRCHQDKDVDWAIEAVDKWYGPKMDRPTRHRTRWVAAARRGEESARDPLIGMLQTNDIPYWQAVAANLLDMWSAEPKVTQALLQALGHTNALVRANAIHSLAPLVESQRFPEVNRAVELQLEDSIRGVRYEAAWALRQSVDPQSRAGRELAFALDINADFPSGQMQKGVYELARNNPARARKHYERAVEVDGNSAPLRHELAVVLSMLGSHRGAVAQLEEACRLEPEVAEYHYKLGLAWNETGDTEQAIKAMQRAVRLDPKHGRACYNLGLALNMTGQTEPALNALLQGELAQPNDPSIPYARATILMQLGRYEEARAAASRALEINPGYPPAIDFLRRVPR